ncbi:hypothetical protein K458DRAFT_385646 [Lentithecium fluviatile CBS 122367]|uniref:Uncharacterized protein n=1 Tax=Lentithecium fluviatile CBS 122367 TaxID=1168545 RepID=A0A6G1JCY3_9PLEO|nr:hypothetical protein K458DRAFT_385646 [Lentithecium fluviatile CBS 122367]
MFGNTTPKTYAESRAKLKFANNQSMKKNQRKKNAINDAKKERCFRSLRILGNIFSDQMGTLGCMREGESIYHALRRYTRDPSNRSHLYAQWNVAKASKPFELKEQPTYGHFPEDLSNLWLPADLIDL